MNFSKKIDAINLKTSLESLKFFFKFKVSRSFDRKRVDLMKAIGLIATILLFSSVFFSRGFCLASEITFAGYDLDNAQWESKSNLNCTPYGKGYASSGWLFFGQKKGSPKYLEPHSMAANTWVEKLPKFVEGISVLPEAQVSQISGNAKIEAPWMESALWESGTLSISASEEVAVMKIKIGKNPPMSFRIGFLIDNLESTATVSAAIRPVDGTSSTSGDGVMTTGGAGSANQKPDWYFWDIRNTKPGEEVVIRLKPRNGIATLGGLVFASCEDAEKLRHIGEFSRQGEYMKDYYVFKEGDLFHLFYNVGEAGEIQDWQQPNNEKEFGHATSKDLVKWKSHDRILKVVPKTWEGQVVSAPSILKYRDTYYMTYTGFDDPIVGRQTIGLATSKDLFKWDRYKENPVYMAPEWAYQNPGGWEDCRDAHIIRYKEEFLMFTMVTTKEKKGAIALSSSNDLIKWKDLGPAIVTFQTPESPRVFEHKGTFYMFATSGHGKIMLKTKDPKSNKWEEIPFRWPSPGLWSGWEVVEDGEGLIFSAFEWKMNGNYIRFWKVDWNGELPVVRY